MQHLRPEANSGTIVWSWWIDRERRKPGWHHRWMDDPHALHTYNGGFRATSWAISHTLKPATERDHRPRNRVSWFLESESFSSPLWWGFTASSVSLPRTCETIKWDSLSFFFHFLVTSTQRKLGLVTINSSWFYVADLLEQANPFKPSTWVPKYFIFLPSPLWPLLPRPWPWKLPGKRNK